MKKIIAIIFLGGLVVGSCAKKDTYTESNLMLQEPEVSGSDTAKATPAAPAKAATAVVKDSVAAK